ncbi:MAG: glycosyltransferase [Rikenellaceae bacterium]
MKKILFFVPGGVGGAERVTLTITKLIDRSKYSVKLVVLGYKESEITRFIPEGLDTIYLNMSRMRENSFYKIYRVIKREKPDFVFSSLRFICIELLIICRFLCRDTKVVVRAQISPIYLDGRAWHDRLLKALYPFAHKIVAQTEEMKAEMIEHYELADDSVQILYNPIDTETIDSKIRAINPFENQGAYIYVAIGRCVPQKGYDILIEAMSDVVEYNPQSQLYIVGNRDDVEYSKKLDRMVDSFHLAENVHFVGFNDNPYKFVFNANCFVLSSRNEGLPNVLLEALYLKIPAIATKCIPIIERLVIDGENGLCVDSEDVEALSKAMVRIQLLKLTGSKSLYVSASSMEYNNLFV